MCAYSGLFSPFFKHEIYALCSQTLTPSLYGLPSLIWMNSRHLLHTCRKVSLLPDGRCLLLVTSSLSLSLSRLTFGSYHWPKRWVQTKKSQNWCLSCRSKFRFYWVRGWVSVLLAPSFREVRTRATRVLITRAETYAGTQNLYVLRYFARHFRSQHT